MGKAHKSGRKRHTGLNEAKIREMEINHDAPVEGGRDEFAGLLPADKDKLPEMESQPETPASYDEQNHAY